MANMNYLKAIGFGVLIWGITFFVIPKVVASVFVFLKVQNALLMQGVITLAFLAATFFLLARSLKVSDKKEMLKYSGSWVVIGLILDGLITTGFTGWAFFKQWNIWLSYLLLLLVPLLAVKKGAKE